MAVSSVSTLLHEIQNIAGRPLSPEKNLAIGHEIIESNVFAIYSLSNGLLKQDEHKGVIDSMLEVVASEVSSVRSEPVEVVRTQLEKSLFYSIQQEGVGPQGIAERWSRAAQRASLLSGINLLDDSSDRCLRLFFAHEASLRETFFEGVGELRGYPAGMVKSMRGSGVPKGGCIASVILITTLGTALLLAALSVSSPW